MRCFAFLGGTSQFVVPVNLRSGVTKAHRHEPVVNLSYREMAEHYGVAVLPVRSHKLRDEAKVEVGVQVVERWILDNRGLTPFTAAQRRDMLELLDDRNGNRSTLVASQMPDARCQMPDASGQMACADR